MAQQHAPHEHAQDGAEARRLESRRRMLRRSLGTAAPVVLTLGSLPVSAGQCVSASAFVSATAFQSRQSGVNLLPCLGLSPTDWLQRVPYWPGGLTTKRKFHQEFGTHALSREFDSAATLLDVLNVPACIEAHVTAALLNAYRGGMSPPFDSPDAIVAIWNNIRANGGFYRGSGEQPAMTPLGTLQWLAMSWDGSGPTTSPMSSPSALPGNGITSEPASSTGSDSTWTGNGNGNAYGHGNNK